MFWLGFLTCLATLGPVILVGGLMIGAIGRDRT